MSAWRICLTKISEKKHLSLNNYLNQIHCPLAAFTTLQHLGLSYTPTANLTRLQELVGAFRPELSPNTQNRPFEKNGSCIQIQDTTKHRLTSQDHGELHNFCSEIKLLITNISNNKPACSILIGDFNAEC